MVVKPMVEYFFENGFKIMIASPMKDRAEEVIGGNPLGSSVTWSMGDKPGLEKLINEYDITVSLLPYKYHTEVALACIHNRKSLITTSYEQAGMADLDKAAKQAGVILLNEIGLDPGIDHMSAMRIIDYIHNNNGNVEVFYSLCGALPAPECADNPLKYKFTWSPKGVILASRNDATYLKNGIKIQIEGSKLFKDRFSYHFPGIGELEVYPNRDSFSYINIYGIPEIKTMYRGTFRYKGWCETLDVMNRLNLLEESVKNYTGLSYAGFMAERSGTEVCDLKNNIAIKYKIPLDSLAMKSLDYLGFFSDEILLQNEASPFEITSERMIHRMLLSDSEKDMILLKHIFLASYPDGNREVIRSSIIDFGSPSTNTAIARTVALPAAIAVKKIIEKEINLIGVYRPVVPEIYNPILNELKTLGIEMKEEYGLPESEIIP